jgi:hypothetical protein
MLVTGIAECSAFVLYRYAIIFYKKTLRLSFLIFLRFALLGDGNDLVVSDVIVAVLGIGSLVPIGRPEQQWL